MFYQTLNSALLVLVGLEPVTPTGLPGLDARRSVPMPSRASRVIRLEAAQCRLTQDDWEDSW
jgi:hypothetical protein